MNLYKWIINEEQLEAVKIALNSYVCLGVGQFQEVLLNLGFQLKLDSDYFSTLHEKEIEQAIESIKYKLFKMSFRQNHSVDNPCINETVKICYDLFETIRLKLAENLTGELTLVSDNISRISKNGILHIEICTEEEKEKYMPRLKSKIKNKIIPVTSIYDLKAKCNNDNPNHEKYQKLAIIAARNLGCSQPQPTLDQAFSWFNTNVMETQDGEGGGEEGVVGEINFCIDLVK
jgi:hypothetical protein